jgi:hypothetical protein
VEEFLRYASKLVGERLRSATYSIAESERRNSRSPR